MVENLAQLQNRKSILGIKSNRKEIDESHLHRRQIEGEARIAVPPLRADAGEPLPDPRRRPRHDLRCSNSTDHKRHPVAGGGSNNSRHIGGEMRHPKRSGGRRRRGRSRRAGARRRRSRCSRPSRRRNGNPALASHLALFPAASLSLSLYARGFMAACSRSSNHGRGGEIRQGGRADPEKAGESG